MHALRLPSGLAFSAQLRPVIYSPNYNEATWCVDSLSLFPRNSRKIFLIPGWRELRRALNLGNSSYPGMSCPYLRRESDPDEQYYLLNWYLDPEYTLYEGCQCAKVRSSKQ